MRLLICAGGTGGGVYPALAVLSAVSSEVEHDGLRHEHAMDVDLQVLWVGSEGGMEADLVMREDMTYTTIPAAGLHGVGWRALPDNLWRLWQGLLSSRRILREFRPDLLFFTGGYLAVPMAVASRLPALGVGRPCSLLFVPDIEPGLALRTLARFADAIAATAEATLAYLPRHARVKVTGYPTRSELQTWDKQSARESLGLDRDIPVLLVFGGSSGARSINRALLGVLPGLLDEMQVLHISGRRDWSEVEAAKARLSADLPVNLVARYQAFPYLHEQMGAALAAADLAVSRAGASSLGEFPLFGLPAVLVPYPHAWRYQQVNAEYLEEYGAAVIIPDAELPERLLPTVHRLIKDKERISAMRKAMHALAQPQAAQKIARMISSLATSGRGAG